MALRFIDWKVGKDRRGRAVNEDGDASADHVQGVEALGLTRRRALPFHATAPGFLALSPA